MGMGGVGGYGGSPTMNQDQRGPRYGVHRTISRYLSLTDDVYTVKCLDCEQEWKHTKSVRKYPKRCRPRDV